MRKQITALVWRISNISFTMVLFLALAITTMAPAFIIAGAADPEPGTYFEYEYEQKVDRGDGEYYGYSETTEGDGRYEILSWGPWEVEVGYRYDWEYRNNEGDRDWNSEEGIFTFDLFTGLYTSQIDLDDEEYTSQPFDTLGQWIWVSPGVKEGDEIYILDEYWEVTDRDKTLWSNYVPRKVIEVEASGDGYRDDEYGEFSYTYTDKLYFEKETGMFFAERYEEWDDGEWQGEWAEFRYTIDIDVVESSYEVEIAWLILTVCYTHGILFTIGLIFGTGYLIYRARYVSRYFSVRDFPELGKKGKDSSLPGTIGGHTWVRSEDVRLRRIWRMEDLPHLANNATDYFGPFLAHWAEKALMAGDKVAVVYSRTYGLLGFSMYNREAKIGTILCKNTELTESLRQFLRCKDFFSERRHHIFITSSIRRDKGLVKKLGNVGNEAYNIFETHSVWELAYINPVTYDTQLVRPIRDADLNEVFALAKKIFRGRAKRWITSCLGSGDLGYVAVVDGRIVGFGFACVCGTHGRLHTLGVAKEFRGRGIGKALHAARLETMRQMGVTRVIDEIADWNLASQRISTLSGFKRTGSMWVETIRDKRIKKNIVRR